MNDPGRRQKLANAETTWPETAGDDFAETFSMPGASEADSEDLRLGFLIHDVSRLRRNAFDQLMKPLGVTRSQWWLLAHLSRHNGVMQTELAQLLDIAKVSLGGLIVRLEASKLVERRPDSVDRRIKRVFLTSAGQTLLRKMRILEQLHNRDVLMGLTRDDRAALADMLVRIKKNLRTISA